MELADRLLPRVAPGLVATRSVRVGGRAPQLLAVADPGELEATAVTAVQDLAGAWASVGVIVPGTERRDALAAALLAAGVDAGQGARAVTGAAVSVVSPAEAKGLEFDGVVVVEPARFADEALDDSSAGRLLYIALTRAVQELVVVHAEPLPADLV